MRAAGLWKWPLRGDFCHRRRRGFPRATRICRPAGRFEPGKTGIPIAESDGVIDAPPSSLFTALLVEPDHVDRVMLHSALALAGFRVIATNNLRDADDALTWRPPHVLVTNLRLGAHDGLQLARRGYAERPRMTVIVTSSRPDPILQGEAERMGATFVLKPVQPEHLLAAVYRTALRPVSAHDAAPIRPPFERRRGDRRATCTNVSVERRCAPRRRDPASVLLALPAAV
jgi:DNA-binding response OmpR family regulator